METQHDRGDTLHNPLGPDSEREVVLVPHSGESPVHSSHALIFGLSLVHFEIDHLSWRLQQQVLQYMGHWVVEEGKLD